MKIMTQNVELIMLITKLREQVRNLKSAEKDSTTQLKMAINHMNMQNKDNNRNQMGDSQMDP